MMMGSRVRSSNVNLLICEVVDMFKCVSWTRIGTAVLFVATAVLFVAQPLPLPAQGSPGGPGDGSQLAGVHPSYTLIDITPDDNFPGSCPAAPVAPAVDPADPKVTGLTFLPNAAPHNGRLLAADFCYLESNSEIYAFDGVKTTVDGSDVTKSLYADGFRYPLGLLALDSDNDGDLNDGFDGVYVYAQPGLFRLRDLNGDGDALDDVPDVPSPEKELIPLVTTGQDVTIQGTSGHEWNFGIIWLEDKLWLALSSELAGGKSSRGHVVSVDPTDWTVKIVASGLRTPNDLGVLDGNLFTSDNQGQNTPVNEFIHIPTNPDPGFERHFGFPNNHEFQSHGTTPPTLWLPHGEVAMSPSEPMAFPTSTQFAGQMLLATMTHGGAKRIFLEQIDGEFQGAVFRFTQGLEVGPMRVVADEQDHIYIGGQGHESTIPWGWKGTLRGLEKLVPTGVVPFEMLAVRIQQNGLEIEFTKPVDLNLAYDPENYIIRQWHYVGHRTEEDDPAYFGGTFYGGSEQGVESLRPQSIAVSMDRTKVFLEQRRIGVDELGQVVYVRLRNIYDENGEYPWSTEAWYTLHSKGTVEGPNFTVAPPPPTDVTNGRLAWWKFDEADGDDVFDSAGSFDGTAPGAVRTLGAVGTAMVFDGVDDVATVAAAALNLGGAFTLSAWVRSPVTCAGDKVLLAKGPTDAGGFELLLDEQNEVHFRASDIGDVASGMILPDSEWTHVAVAYDGTFLRFARNGATFSVKTATGSLGDETADLGLGANAAESARYFEGRLDEVMVHNRTLSAAEIEQLGAPLFPLLREEGLIAYWSFQEGCGTSVRDRSGNAYHGILSGGGTWQPGVLDNSLLLDGIDDRIDLGNSLINPSGDWSFVCWVRSDTPFSGTDVLLQKKGAPESFADFKLHLSNGSPGLSEAPAFGNPPGSGALGKVDGDGNWHHVATTYNGIDLKYYIDGTMKSFHTQVWGYVNGAAGPTTIGAKPTGTDFFAGSIDEMALYNRVLTDDEITTLVEFSHNVPGDCNQDGVLDISDAVCALGVLFTGVPFAFFPCGDGTATDPGNISLMDWQQPPDGFVDLSDVVAMLHFLFLGTDAHSLAVPGSEVSECVPIMGCRANPNCD